MAAASSSSTMDVVYISDSDSEVEFVKVTDGSYKECLSMAVEEEVGKIKSCLNWTREQAIVLWNSKGSASEAINYVMNIRQDHNDLKVRASIIRDLENK